MQPLAVQEIEKLAEVETHKSTPAVAFADFLLTSLFSHSPALLYAEDLHQGPEVTWFVRPIRDTIEQQDLICAASDRSSVYFRAVLARFGHHYMSGQLYGGYSLRNLRQRGREYRCHIYMSNNGQSGFWIRIYAAVV